MFLFGHLGITIGLFFIIGYFVPGIRCRINYWYVAFGAILPDIIDKLIGRVLFAYSLASGRFIAHTLIFSLLLALMGFYLYKRNRDARLLLVSGASFFHLIEDIMWTQPVNLLWPLFGWGFPHGVLEHPADYFLSMFRESFVPDFSYVFISEAIGFTIIILFIVMHMFSGAKTNR